MAHGCFRRRKLLVMGGPLAIKRSCKGRVARASIPPHLNIRFLVIHPMAMIGFRPSYAGVRSNTYLAASLRPTASFDVPGDCEPGWSDVELAA